jgi:hypothetical protein
MRWMPQTLTFVGLAPEICLSLVAIPALETGFVASVNDSRLLSTRVFKALGQNTHDAALHDRDGREDVCLHRLLM